MAETIATLILVLLLVGGALAKVIADRRRGIVCTGCPAAASCSRGRTCQLMDTEAGKEE